MFDFDIEIRLHHGLVQFVAYLQYLLECKKGDEKRYLEAKKEDPGAIKLLHVAENYLNISNIHSVTIKAHDLILGLLKEVSPSTFKAPFYFSPIVIQLVHRDFAYFSHDNDDDYLNEKYIPQEIGIDSKKYNYRVDCLEVEALRNDGSTFMDMKRVLANQNYTASRIVIKNCGQSLTWEDADVEAEEHITQNDVLKQHLEYLHVYGKKDYSRFFFELLGAGETFENLYEILLTYPDFEDFPKIVESLDEKNFSKTFENFPKLKRVIFVNKEYAKEIEKFKFHSYDKNEPLFTDFTGVAITTDTGEKFMGSIIYMDSADSVLLKPDILFEFRTGSYSEKSYTISEKYHGKFLVEIPLLKISSVDMTLRGNDDVSQNSMSKLTQLLFDNNPKARCRLKVTHRLAEVCEEQFLHLQHLVLKKCEKGCLDIISDENWRSLSKLEIENCQIDFEEFEAKFSDFVMVDKFIFRADNHNCSIISFHHLLVPFLADNKFPNLEYLDVFLSPNCSKTTFMCRGKEKTTTKKEYISGNIMLLNNILSESKRLFFVKYNSQIDRPWGYAGDEARDSRYLEAGDHPVSRFIEIIT